MEYFSVKELKKNGFKKIGKNVQISKRGSIGSNLTVSIIKKAKNHLTKKDSMKIPLISLSNVQKIVNVAEENFSGVKIVKSKDWFLPKEMEGLKGKMNELKSKNYINFDEKFGKIICKTSIAVCKKPKNIE